MHGAHPRPAPRARVRRRDRHACLHAAGDPRLLRRRRGLRRLGPLLGRGVARRHGRVGEARRGGPGRDVPRHLRRRALRHRPGRPPPLSPRAGRPRHHRPEERPQPTRVRDRRHRRGGPHRALPREAFLGAGLHGHDQHWHLRARARGAAPRSRRHAARLLEGALPAAPGDGEAAVRLRLRGLLAGHRKPRPVPAGQLRRARRARAAGYPGHPTPRQRLGGGGGRPRRPRGGRGARVRRQLLPHRAEGLRRAVLRAHAERHPGRPCPDRPVGRRLFDGRGPQRGRRGSDRRPGLRHPPARAPPRGRRGRGQLHDRRGERRHARRPHLPLQGGRVGRPRRPEPDLGVAALVTPDRPGRDRRPDRRRPDAGDRPAPRPRARHRARPRRPGRDEPGRLGLLPADPPRAHRGRQLGRRPRHRPAGDAGRRQPPLPEDRGLRRGHPRPAEPQRPGGRADPHLRAAGDARRRRPS